MKKISVLVTAVLLSASLLSAGNGDKHADDIAIKKVIKKAYVIGAHTEGNAEKMKAGFHKNFVMQVYNEDGSVRQVSIDDWTSRIKPRKPNPDRKVSSDIKVLHRAGNAAVAKVELFINGKHIFTDYMSLYKFDDGWKIVGKTFYRQPKDS